MCCSYEDTFPANNILGMKSQSRKLTSLQFSLAALSLSRGGPYVILI
jgi:hypothetical protein